MKRITFFTTTFLLILAGCQPAVQKTPLDPQPLRVKVLPAGMLDYKVPAKATGMLSTATEMKLSFKTGGIIKQVHVKEGRSVSRGDVLAELDLSEIKAQASQARIGLEKAGRDLDRTRNLYRDSVGTLEQYQNARSAYELARAQKQITDFNLLHSRIIAPSDGKIQKILVETNEVTGPGHPAILFASTENDWVVRASLTDKDVVRFSIGDSARIFMDAFPGTEFKAEVTGLGTIADPLTGSYEVELMVLKAHPQFRTGFFSRVTIFPKDVTRSIVVPVEALLDAGDHRAHVFVLQQGENGKPSTVLKRNLRTGQILGSQVVVLEGLDEGELVITDGARYLKAGMEVNPVNHPETDQP